MRIAGVNVGEVTTSSARATRPRSPSRSSEDGQPIHEDATVEIRPRLFLEGNFFLDLQPGSPSAPELAGRRRRSRHPDGDRGAARRGADRAARPTRAQNLQRLLEGYGTALTYEPTAPRTRDQDPDVAGRDGGARRSTTPSTTAARPGATRRSSTRRCSATEPHDLSKLIAAQRDVFSELARSRGRAPGPDHELQHDHGSARDRAGQPARDDRASSRRRSRRPSPRSRNLNDALPPLRAFALELEPSMRELPATIEAAGPVARPGRALLRDDELGGAGSMLAQAAPDLAQTAERVARASSPSSTCSAAARPTSSSRPATRDHDDAVGADADSRPASRTSTSSSTALVQQPGETPELRRQRLVPALPARRRRRPGADATNPGGGFRNTRSTATRSSRRQGSQPVRPRRRCRRSGPTSPATRNAVPDLNGPAAASAPPSPTVHAVKRAIRSTARTSSRSSRCSSSGSRPPFVILSQQRASYPLDPVPRRGHASSSRPSSRPPRRSPRARARR